MEREISSGAMLGVVLLALAAVIGLGFGVFAIAKGIANEGTVNVQDSLGTVSSQVFLDYDQKIVTGTQAIAGLKTFEGKPYAVLMQTAALRNGRALHPDHDAYVVEVASSDTLSGSTGDVFLNYNAVIASTTGGKPTTTAGGSDYVDSGNLLIYKKNGAYYIKNGLAAASGNVVFDNMTAGVFKTGNAEFVATSSKYQANIIKDESDNNMGIIFEEIN